MNGLDKSFSACASVSTHVCVCNVCMCDEIRIIQDIHLFCSWWGDWVGLGDMTALSQRITLLSLPFSLLFSLPRAVLSRPPQSSHLITDAACVMNSAGATCTHACASVDTTYWTFLFFSFADWCSSSTAICVSWVVWEQKYSTYRLITQFSQSNLSNQKAISYWAKHYSRDDWMYV